MKTRNVALTIITTLFLTSCVVRSLNPFYTKKSISFDERFIGNWKDAENGIWKVIPFKEEITKENPVEKMKKEDLELYKKYKDSYYIKRTHHKKEVYYIVTPFKINGQTFLDFYPSEYQDYIDDLLHNHIVFLHSLVKYDITNDGKIEVKWLDEDKIEELFKKKKIKIKHNKMGMLENKYLLTASSKELKKFIEKYMNSEDEDKWETSVKYTLSKIENAE